MHELPDRSFPLSLSLSTTPRSSLSSSFIRWDLDDNRLVNVHEYDINVGKGKKMYDGHDAAPGALFALVTKVMMITTDWNTAPYIKQ